MNEIGVSKNNVKVYADIAEGHLATHLAEDENLMSLIKEALLEIDLEGEEVAKEYVFNRIVGECDLKETDENDEIVYAIRKHRDRYTRFVKNATRHQCSSVTLILKKQRDGYQLWSTWIGHLVPSFPKLNSGVDDERDEKTFWKTHALVWGKQEAESDTITDKCPWEKQA